MLSDKRAVLTEGQSGLGISKQSNKNHCGVGMFASTYSILSSFKLSTRRKNLFIDMTAICGIRTEASKPWEAFVAWAIANLCQGIIMKTTKAIVVGMRTY